MDRKSEGSDRPHPTFFKSVRNYFREYCNCSSIHGFRYFGEKRTYFERPAAQLISRPHMRYFEALTLILTSSLPYTKFNAFFIIKMFLFLFFVRVWWFIVFSMTLAGCVIAIMEVYKKWVRSPVIVSFATRETPIYSIPFPAVTICPQAKSIQSLYNHTLMMRKHIEKKPLTEREQKLLDYMGLICDKNRIVKFSDTPIFTEKFYEVLEEIGRIEMFLGCEYMGEVQECHDIFKPIITDEGICFSFNMMDRSEIYDDNVVFYKNFNEMENLTGNTWSMEDHYSNEAGLYPYPRRALLAGAKNSLNLLLLTSKSHTDSSCKESLNGFKVTLHIPMRVPRPSQQYFRVPLNQVLTAAVQPVMITTSDSVKSYKPARRECYFPSEKKLKYFKIYTALNCKFECLTNYTLYYCGCVNYFMPRDNNTDICGIGNLSCMEEAEKRLQLGSLHNKLDKLSRRHNRSEDGEELRDCDCMPMCTDLSYDVDISQSDWYWLDYERAFSKDGELGFEKDEFHLSRLTLYFKSTRFITSQRHELYGPTDFLANFGGLLGLFTGFSVLSLMEAIYFLTVRLCCNSKLYGYWAGPES
ncbi:hypothetical protein NQ318_023062 [Aromia moschata]|uniref:Uncharacterized protein n=1 Tax=Aromia moschata TaxID=1265417 RepID=A0AAV8XWX0_9CUCU|nr:hypothetical protein NQ318_023062 [Aromia moschata]